MRRLIPVAAATFLLGAVTAPSAGIAADKGPTASDKKPGETCEKLARGTDAYKDCIAKAAHADQTGKGAGITKDVDKGKKGGK